VNELATIAGFLRGRFIVFEGADGSGKSTQLRRLVKAIGDAGLCVLDVREPGGTAIGEEVRKILLHTKEQMGLTCEMLLYMASRAQLVEEKIRPALASGHVVIADRFVSSTLAYQGAGGGLSEADIRAVAAVATERVSPDLVVIFDVDAATAARRTRGSEPAKGRAPKNTVASVTLFDDRIEQRGADFHNRVREGYLAQAASEPGRHLVVDGRQEPDVVWASLVRGLVEWVGRGQGASRTG